MGSRPKLLKFFPVEGGQPDQPAHVVRGSTQHMAHKMAKGSTRNGRDSHGQRLGVKKYAGEFAKPGSILIRQRGTGVRPGLNVRKGTDDTLYAVVTGVVSFTHKRVVRYTGHFKMAKYVNVTPLVKSEAQVQTVAEAKPKAKAKKA